MAEIQLYSFPARLRAEFIRLMLVAAGQKFEDNVITYEEWDLKKADSPYGALPYMIYKGKTFGQSVAIANFFARELGFYGKTNLDSLRIDEVVQLGEDLKDIIVSEWFNPSNATKKAEVVQKFTTDYFPRFLRYFETLLRQNEGNGFFVGNTLSLADFQVYDLLTTALGWYPQALETVPSLQKLRSNVEAVPAIKAYLDVRPKLAN